MTADTQNFAVVRTDTSKAAILPRPIPRLPDDYILVRTKTIALNPTDWTTLDAKGLPGQVVGVDYAGVVEKVGKDVKKFRAGDRVAGMAHGGNDKNHENGAFQRFIAVKAVNQLLIPEGISFEDSMVGSAVGTVGYALYYELGLAWPGKRRKEEEGEPILIYGGSTATGTVAIQFAKQSGLKVYTTASRKHFEMLKGRGADGVYDYHDPNVGEQINQDTNDRLRLSLDAVNTDSTVPIIAQALSSSGGTSINLLSVDIPRSNVKNIFFLGYAVSGEDYIFEGEFEKALPEVGKFAVEWFEFCEKRWREGKFVGHPTRVREGGFQGALEGMEEMRSGKGPSGEKWAYVVDETVWPA